MKKFLTINDLIEFCVQNNFSKFSSKEFNAELSVQMPAVATFGKSDDSKHTEGLCPFNASAKIIQPCDCEKMPEFSLAPAL